MAKYQQYAEYKDSRVEWLGEIPKEWIPIRLKHLLLESLVYGANEAAEDDNPKNPRYIRITDMNSDGTLDPNTFRSLPLHIAKYYLLKDGDILLARSGATVGKSFYYKSEFGLSCFAGYLIRARPHRSKLDSRFAYWFFQSDSYWKYVTGSQIKATIQNVSAEKYGDLYLSLPKKIEEQSQIANFLDHETAKIDSLIEKQQQLIQLLKEKRQVVISQAVTKGLNPDVPMKDSGVEWLGEVPEHWEISRLKHILDMPMRNGLFKKKDQFGSGSLLVNVTDLFVENNFINTDNLESVQTTFDERKAYKINYGDLFFVRSSLKLEGIGRSACFLSHHDNAVFECHVVNARPNVKKISPKYLTRYLNSIAVIQEYIRRSKTTTMTTIDQNGISSINIVVPPKVEQIHIDNYLDNKLEIFSDGEKKAKAIIDFLIERRTALISAAVTGKIDVRNWQKPTEAKMELST